jgi:hypothetical protein
VKKRIWELVGIGGTGLLSASLVGVGVGCNVFEPPPTSIDSMDGTTPESSLTEGSSSGARDSTADSTADGADAGRSDTADAAVTQDADAGTGFTGDGSTAPWWHFTNDAGCLVEGKPTAADRPAMSDPSSGTLPPIYLMMTRVEVGTNNDDKWDTANLNAWQDMGFTMDGVCTNSPTCQNSLGKPVNETACVNPNYIPSDGNNCRDNEVGKTYQNSSNSPLIGGLFGLDEPDFNCEFKRGTDAFVFKISGYNGQLNDDQVRLDLYSSMGLVNLPSWTCRPASGGALDPNWPLHADWVNTEQWTIAQINFALNAQDAGNDLPDSKWFDQAAYVRNGWLVAQMPQGTVFWSDGERTIGRAFVNIMYRGTIVAPLHQGLDGLWSVGDDNYIGPALTDAGNPTSGLPSGSVYFASLPGDLLQGFQDMGFCQNMCDSYTTLTDYLNIHQDVTSQPGLPSNTPCDALSVTFEFHARQTTTLPFDIRLPGPRDVDPAALKRGDVLPFWNCPEPINCQAPRQGCTCVPGMGCSVDPSLCDGGAEAASDSGLDGGVEAAGDSGLDARASDTGGGG